MKNKKYDQGFSVWLVVLILAIMIAGGGYYWYQNNKNSNENDFTNQASDGKNVIDSKVSDLTTDMAQLKKQPQSSGKSCGAIGFDDTEADKQTAKCIAIAMEQCSPAYYEFVQVGSRDKFSVLGKSGEQCKLQLEFYDTQGGGKSLASCTVSTEALSKEYSNQGAISDPLTFVVSIMAVISTANPQGRLVLSPESITCEKQNNY